MQSQQEQLMGLFSKLAMGEPFFFIPDKYRRGQSPREPADLVWACNGCVVFIYLCRLKDARKSMEHNLRQAKGWLRAWRTLGQVAKGRNSHNTFSIGSTDAPYPHVVILSVIECADAMGIYHRDEVATLGVTMCATIPLSAVACLTGMHASMLDVLHIVDWLRVRHAGAILERDVLSGIAGYHAAAWQASGAHDAWPVNETDPEAAANHFMIDDFLHTMSMLPLERLRNPTRVDGPVDDKDLFASYVANAMHAARLFSDLTLVETLWLATRVKHCIERVRARVADPTRPPNTSPYYLEHVALHRYDFTLSAVDGDGHGPPGAVAAEMMLQFSRSHDRTGANRLGPCIHLLTDSKPPSFGCALVAIGPQPPPSATEVFLDRVRAEQTG
jgi:hypothetical protein